MSLASNRLHLLPPSWAFGLPEWPNRKAFSHAHPLLHCFFLIVETSTLDQCVPCPSRSSHALVTLGSRQWVPPCLHLSLALLLGRGNCLIVDESHNLLDFVRLCLFGCIVLIVCWNCFYFVSLSKLCERNLFVWMDESIISWCAYGWWFYVQAIEYGFGYLYWLYASIFHAVCFTGIG